MIDSRVKKRLLQSVPYLVLGLYATKGMQAYRLADGIDFATKVLNLGEGFYQAWESPFPSLVGTYLLFGLFFTPFD